MLYYNYSEGHIVKLYVKVQMNSYDRFPLYYKKKYDLTTCEYTTSTHMHTYIMYVHIQYIAKV